MFRLNQTTTCLVEISFYFHFKLPLTDYLTVWSWRGTKSMTGQDLDCSVSANFKDQRLGGQQIDHQIYLENSNILWLWTLILISSWKALFLKEIKIIVWKWPRLSSLLKENICTCNSQKQRYFKSMWRKPKWMVVLFFVLSRGWKGGGGSSNSFWGMK